MPMQRRAIDNDTSDDGSGTPSGPSVASDWAFTTKSTGPTPGNVTEKPVGVKSCGVPFSSKLVTPAGKFPGGGDIPVSESDVNVARNPIVAPVGDRKVSSSRTSLTPIPPPSSVIVPILIICLLNNNVAVPVTVPTLRLADSVPATIVAPTMSVITWIEPVPVVGSRKEIVLALAGPVPTITIPSSTSETNKALSFIGVI